MSNSSEHLNILLNIPPDGVGLKIEGIDDEFQLKPVADSPCRVGCPAGVNVKAYVGLIARGNFERALAVVRERNPLPGICGRVCTHPCESECRRNEIDEPVAIRQLKRFIADYALSSAPAVLPAETPRRRERVAIVGAGPAGLTAASDLRRLGYQVTIFEAQHKPGGMLVWGIPPFRLPRNVIEEEINSILNLGIALVLNTRIENPAQLLDEGFAAVFFAPGHQQSVRLGLPFEDELEGIVDSLKFLRESYEGAVRNLHGRVLVIGGGDSAIDSARVAKRLGAQEVTIVYRRTRSEMPAAAEEIEEAEREGVRFEFLVQPVGLMHRERRLTGLRCVRCELGEPDASGRRRPVPVPGSEFIIDAEWVITALGQKPAQPVSGFPDRVFIGGDAAGGAATVINAIASGHEGARQIDALLTGRKEAVTAIRAPELELAPVVLTAVRLSRSQARLLPVHSRRGFEEIEAPFTPEQALQEASRCLRCGPCNECVLCSYNCPKHQLLLQLEDMSKPVIMRVHGLEGMFFTDTGPRGIEIEFSQPGRVVSGLVQPLVVHTDPYLCRACGRCLEICPHQALKTVKWQSGIEVTQVDYQRCRGCGTCVTVCPSGALQLPTQIVRAENG